MLKHFIVFLLFLISLNVEAIDRVCKINIDRVLLHDFSDLHNPNHLEIVKNNLSDNYSNIKVISNSITIYSTNGKIANALLAVDQKSKLLKKEKLVIRYHIGDNKTFILSPIFDITGRYMSGILILGYKRENVKLSENLEIGIDLFSSYLSQFLHECKEN